MIMHRFIAAAILLALLAPAHAQQQELPDPAWMQEAIAAMQRHREYTANALVSAEVTSALLMKANAALRDKVAELEKELTALRAKAAVPSPTPPVPDPAKPVDPAPAK